MTKTELEQRVSQFDWYHNIDLGQGVTTPGRGFHELWNMIREVRGGLTYAGKRVLDLGSFDGMWAFEAERLGASTVVATDCLFRAYETLLLCKEALRSRVVPYYNVSIYDLGRLDTFMLESVQFDEPAERRRFDIVQNLGLLYHLRDPMFALAQTRSVLKEGGYALFETAVVLDDERSTMLLNGIPSATGRIYADSSTWWAPTLPCLREMLAANLFTVVEGSEKTLAQHRSDDHQIGRVCLLAEAVGHAGLDRGFLSETFKPYRTPGLVLDPLGGRDAIQPGIR